MPDVTVFGFSFDAYVRTACLALEEKGVDYTTDVLALHLPEPQAHHPFSKSPAFRHGDVDLFETVAITTYVDEAFEGPALQPRDPADKARMHQWISAFNDNGAPALLPIIVHRLVLCPPDEAIIAGNLAMARKTLEVFDAALADSEWLIGPSLTLADLFLAPPIVYLPMFPEGDELLAGLANLDRWFATIAARPSFAATEPDMPSLF